SRREALHRRIAARFEAMIAAGLLEEVARLRARGDLHAGLPSMRAVGYRQAWAWLEEHPGVDPRRARDPKDPLLRPLVERGVAGADRRRLPGPAGRGAGAGDRGGALAAPARAPGHGSAAGRMSVRGRGLVVVALMAAQRLVREEPVPQLVVHAGIAPPDPLEH